MRELYGADFFRAFDRVAAEHFGVSPVVLMENAGRGTADALCNRFVPSGHCLILAGPGNNGGDGFVLARHLVLRGWHVELIQISPNKNVSAEFAANLEIVQRLSIPIEFSDKLDNNALREKIARADVIVDALLGTGSKGVLRGEIERLVCALNSCTVKKDTPHIMSLDIPTGVDPDTGEIASFAVRADLTVTYAAPKIGLFVMPGADCAGEVRTTDIGIAREGVLPHLERDAPGASQDAILLIEENDAGVLIPQTSHAIHKGDRGRLLICGGCETYRGAPVLTGLGALRAGCGLVVLAIPEEICESAAALLPEAVLLPLPANPQTSAQKILPWMERCEAAVVGPGMGRDEFAKHLCEFFWNAWNKPLLVDADGLFFLARLGGRRRDDALVTPHEGEAATLLGMKPEEISACRLRACREIAARYAPTLLKGRRTLVCDGPHARVLPPGHACLAVPGSGDVLSGACGALLARGLSPLAAGNLGGLLHAKAGAALGATWSTHGTLARDIAVRIASEMNAATRQEA